MPTFIDFRDGRGGEVCRRLGVDIGALETWDGYTDVILSLPDRTGFIRAAAALAEGCSPTERTVVAAVLFAADLTTQADGLCGGPLWRLARNFSADTATAVAAAMLRRDHPTASRPALRVV